MVAVGRGGMGLKFGCSSCFLDCQELSERGEGQEQKQMESNHRLPLAYTPRGQGADGVGTQSSLLQQRDSIG